MEKNLEELIKKSGNNLHTEVAELLEKTGWNVDISSYYYDDTTDKPREIDIMASKEKIVSLNGHGKSSFNVFLFIECKYFKEDIAFRMYDNRAEDSVPAIIFQGMNEDILNESNTSLKTTHHYVSVPYVAKLFDSRENNEVFNAVTGIVKSLVFFRDRWKKKGLYYPLVVYSGIDGLYPVEGSNLSNLDNIKPIKNLIFSLNYSYRSVVSSALETKHFCVDFMNKQELEKFIELIEKQEINQLTGLAQFLLHKGRWL